MSDFYVDTLNKLIHQGVLARTSRVLVVCGGPRDQQALLECGFENVVISNLDSRMTGNEFAPFDWSFQDAEQLEYEDDCFDFCVAHSGLHHCRSPHRALLEMYRVSRKGVIVFEPLDNAVCRLGVRLGLGQDYELAAVAGNDYAYGGLKNTPIPNYVYRWTEREIEKAIQSNCPLGKHRFRYFYRLRVPWERTQLMNSRLLYLAFAALMPLARLFTLAFPHASNNFAFVVQKPDLPSDLYPWLTQDADDIRLDTAWVKQLYR